MARLINEYWYSGVYIIKNVGTNKAYIGSSSDLEGRIKGHKKALLTGNHSNKQLQQDYNNGARFLFDILYAEPVKKNSTASRRKLYQIERKYIEKYKTKENGYNKLGIHNVEKEMSLTVI